MSGNRVTKVSLIAEVSGYIAGMDKAAQKTREFGSESEKLGKQKEAFNQIGVGLLGIGTIAAAGVGIAVAKFAEFSKEMSQVKSLSHGTTAEMETLSNAALTMGQSIGFSATEVAKGETELVKAGVSVSQIMGGALKGSLDLAAAGQVSVADATSTAAIAMTQFSLAGKDIPHVADLLAAGADKALGGVGDLSMALKQGGLVAAQFGLSIDETVGTLSEFANAGLLGSDAGTSMKQMFLQLASPSKQAADEMKKYNIQAYDAQGNFVGITKLAGQLQAGLGGVSQAQRNAALSIIFGSDAIRAANILYKDGSEGNQKWITSVNDTGFAADQARGKMDNLSGDVSKLGAAIDSDLIKSGSAANETLRTLAQNATFVVSSVGNLPQPVITLGVIFGTLTAAVALTGGTAMLAVPKFAAFKASLAGMEITLKSAALRSLGAGAAIAGVTLAIGYFVTKAADAKATTAELADTLDKSTGQITKYTTAAVAKKLADDGSFKAAKEAGIGQKELTNAVMQGGSALDDVKKKLDGNNNFFSFFTGEGIRAGNAKDAIVSLRGSVVDSKEAFKDLKKSGSEVADSTGDVASAAGDATKGLTDLSGAADTGSDSLDELKKAIEGFGSAQFDVDAATRDFEGAIDDFTDSVKANGHALNAQKDNFDVGTEAGRKNQAALEDIASSTLKLASAQLSQTGDQNAATAAIHRGRDAFIAAAQKAGLSADAAKKYADKLGLIPGNVTTAIVQQGIDPAIASLDALIAKINDVPSYKAVVIDQQIKQTGAARGVVGAAYNADGGSINGPGTGTSDSILSWLSNGEYVIKAASVQKYGVGFLDKVNAGRYADGGAVRLASGGSVSKNLAAQKRAAAAAEKARKAAAAEAVRKQKAAAALAKALAKASSEQNGFLSDVRRGKVTGTSAVDALYSAASGFTGLAQANMLRSAEAADKSMLKLSKSSDLAASKLDDLKSASASMASSASGKIGDFSVGDYGSASSLKRGVTKNAASVKEFAALLVTLQKNGLSPVLLAQVADLGTVEGLPLARSLSKASTADLKSINASYSSIQSMSTKAGQQVADANYKAQIAAADKNAASITSAIAKQSLALQKIIGKALKVPGYATGGFTGYGPRDAVAGVVHASEFVSTAATTANANNRAALEYMHRGGVIGGYQQGGFVGSPTYIRSAPMQSGISADALLTAIKALPRGGDRFEITTNDPVAAAQAVARRQARRSV